MNLASRDIEGQEIVSGGEAASSGQPVVTNRPVVVSVQDLGKAYGSVQAVKRISFEVVAGETLTLLGPSGCGKTTTLRCIAGLEKPTAGRIVISGNTVFDHAKGVSVEPERRGIGMVFQSYAIWPHMTVGSNVGFPLEIKKRPREEIRSRVSRILKLVGLGDLYDRSASQLSGGQQQRVALARALVFEPQLVLFDEPLSNLDANLRDRMRAELQRLQSELNFTSVFVTHDQQEALSLSDHIVVMKDGLVERAGSPREIFQDPATPFAARFLGCANNLQGEIKPISDSGRNQIFVRVSDKVVLRGCWRGSVPARSGTQGTIAFRANHLSIDQGDAEGGDVNTLAGEITALSFLGDRIDYTVLVDGIAISSEGPASQTMALGDKVRLRISPDDCHVFPGAET